MLDLLVPKVLQVLLVLKDIKESKVLLVQVVLLVLKVLKDIKEFRVLLMRQQ